MRHQMARHVAVMTILIIMSNKRITVAVNMSKNLKPFFECN